VLSPSQRAALTARLRQGRPAGGPPAGLVVDLGTSGSVPAFVVHAVGGTVHEYVPLARELSDALRLWGIEAGGVRPGTSPGRSLGEMAPRYADAVREAQPVGPYRLIGWSMGGVLAFETARLLGDVALVVLIDAPYRTVSKYADSPEALTALFVADALRGAGVSADIPATAPTAEQLDAVAAALGGSDGLRSDLDRRHAVFVAHTSALASYLPTGRLDADAILVSAADTPDSAGDWSGQFGGRVEILRPDAGHYACLRPPTVSAIADAIRKLA
jgi:thioesterase domain-containing protein